MEGRFINDRLIKQVEVTRITGRSRSSCIRDMDAGTFPQKVVNSHGRICGWKLSDILKWMDSLEYMKKPQHNT